MIRIMWPAALALVVLAACAQPDASDEPPPASAGPTASATESATSTPSPAPTPSASSAEGGTDTYTADWAHDFTMSAPAEWEHDTSSGDSYWIGAGVDRYVVMTRRGPAAVDEWVTTLTTQERIVVTEPEPTEVGGAEGYVLDATASEAATEGAVGICMHPGRCWTLFEDVAGYWSIDEGRQNRIWVVDVSGDTILIVTEAPQASFEEWASVVEDALATLDWGE